MLALASTLAAAGSVLGVGVVTAGPADASGCGPAPAGQVAVVVVVEVRSGVSSRCVVVADGAKGSDALAAAGHSLRVEAGFVCAVDGLPESGCAVSDPNAPYWSYWHAAPGGSWTYSRLGAFAYRLPSRCAVEGWRLVDPSVPKGEAMPRTAPPAAACDAPAPPVTDPSVAAPVPPPPAGGAAGGSTGTTVAGPAAAEPAPGGGGSGGSGGSGGGAAAPGGATGGAAGGTAPPAGGTGAGPAPGVPPTVAGETTVAAPAPDASTPATTGPGGTALDAAGNEAASGPGADSTAGRRVATSSAPADSGSPVGAIAVVALLLALGGSTVLYRRRREAGNP